MKLVHDTKENSYFNVIIVIIPQNIDKASMQHETQLSLLLHFNCAIKLALSMVHSMYCIICKAFAHVKPSNCQLRFRAKSRQHAFSDYALSALTLSVGRQEDHPTCKN